jgi:hypothetical protein
MTHRYIGWKIVDVDNPAGYVELGRCWGGDYIEPRWGFSPERSETPEDISALTEGENANISTIQRVRYLIKTYRFEMINDKDEMDAMFESRGKSRELIVQIDPFGSVVPYEDPEENSFYCRFSSWGWEHIAGDIWSLNVELIEEV